MPANYASLIYDAIMTAGISACMANPEPFLGSDNKRLPMNRHVFEVLKEIYQGAWGSLRFKLDEDLNGDPRYKNSRDPDAVIFGMYNIRPGAVDSNDMQRYDRISESMWTSQLSFLQLRSYHDPSLQQRERIRK